MHPTVYHLRLWWTVLDNTLQISFIVLSQTRVFENVNIKMTRSLWPSYDDMKIKSCLHRNITKWSIVFFRILNSFLLWLFVELWTAPGAPVLNRGHDLCNLESTLLQNNCVVISKFVDLGREILILFFKIVLCWILKPSWGPSIGLGSNK